MVTLSGATPGQPPRETRSPQPLVLGLLPFGGGAFEVGRFRSSIVILLTIAALALLAALVSDGEPSRIDAIGLITSWVAATAVSWRFEPPRAEPVMTARTHRGVYHAVVLITALLLVGAGAGAAKGLPFSTFHAPQVLGQWLPEDGLEQIYRAARSIRARKIMNHHVADVRDDDSLEDIVRYTRSQPT